MSFRTILKSEAKAASIYTLSTFLTQLGSFLVVPLFWQRLSLVDYGVIAVIEMIGSFLTLFVGLSLDFAITRFYYEWPTEERRYRVGTLWVLSWSSSLLLGASSIAVLSLVSGLLFPAVAFYPFIFLGLMATVLRSLTMTPYATIRIADKPNVYLVYSLVTFGIGLSLNVYFVVFLNEGLHGYLVSNVIGAFIIDLIGAIAMLRFAVPCLRPGGLREVIEFSLPNVPGNLISGTSSLVDRFLLQQFASLEVLGVYAVSLKFVNLVLYLYNALKLSFIPYLAKTISEGGGRHIENLSRMRLLYTLPIFAFCMAIRMYVGEFVLYAGRSEYFVVAEWVPWLLGPVVISGLTIFLAPGLFLAKRSDKTWIPSMSVLLTVVASGLFLIPLLQLPGVVISRYASAIVAFLVTLSLSEKYYPIPIHWKKLLVMLGLLGAGMGLSGLIESGNVLVDVVAKGVLLFAFVAVGLLIYTGRRSATRVLLEYVSGKINMQ